MIYQTILLAASAVAVISIILFQLSLDFKYGLCFFLGLGYFDFLGTYFQVAVNKCVADSSMAYLKRDLPAGGGKLIKVKEFDCTKNLTFQRMREESNDFTIPFVCKGAILNNPCRHWSLDYFINKTRDDEMSRGYVIEPIASNRKAFMKNEYPTVVTTTKEMYTRQKQGESIFISFDNYYLTKRHPELVAEMELGEMFPGVKFILNTLFVSNFKQKSMGSPFHAAPQDNFFFQCKGRKHWFYMEPKDLKYAGSYLTKGVIFTSNFVDEKEIVSRVNIYETVVEEGDIMFNPPFWLHAVGTMTGETISVANRVWRTLTPPPDNLFIDIMYKINFPIFIGTVLWQRFTATVAVNSVTINQKAKELNYMDEIGGGLLNISD